MAASRKPRILHRARPGPWKISADSGDPMRVKFGRGQGFYPVLKERVDAYFRRTGFTCCTVATSRAPVMSGGLLTLVGQTGALKIEVFKDPGLCRSFHRADASISHAWTATGSFGESLPAVNTPCRSCCGTS